MKANIKITLEDGLELNKPTMTIENVIYNWLKNTVLIECIFKEENALYNPSRNFQFDTKGKELTSSDILSLINNHEILKNFK